MQNSESVSEIPKAAPVKPIERIIDLDVLRGIALFGILVVNLFLFANPIAILATDTGMWTEWYNQSYLFFSRVFFEGKFITMFSFLFGLGFYIFTERLKEKQLPVRLIFFRRMVLLFLFGMLHAWLFWAGDILGFYALGGTILMLFFLYRTDKTLKIWIGIIGGGFIVLFSLLVLFVIWGLSMPDVAPGIKEGFMEAGEEFKELFMRGLEVYATGSFSEMMTYRGEEIAFAWFGMMISPMGIPFIISIFLLGFLIGRKGLLDEPRLLRILLIPRRWKLFVPGLVLSILYATSYIYADPVLWNGWTILQMVSIMLGAPLLMLGYSGFILKWLDENKATNFLHQFAPVGRMALTNYIMQTVICTTIFYGYGLGLIGQFPPVYILPLAIVIFAFQVYLSNWYFRKYKMGPLEKVWRMGTYWKFV